MLGLGPLTGGRVDSPRRSSGWREYRFFHWHLEFPHLFDAPESTTRSTTRSATGWYGGFDVMLGNPPWEHTELKEQEFFAVREPSIAAAAGAKRKKRISALPEDNPALYVDDEDRSVDRRLRHFAANSGRFPLCGRGRIKTDAFSPSWGGTSWGRTDARTDSPNGHRNGCDDTVLLPGSGRASSLVSLFDFENRKPLFDGVDRRVKFCLLT